MAETVLVVCRPFRAKVDFCPGVSFFFTSEADINADDLRIIGRNFARIHIESCLAHVLRARDGVLDPRMTVVPDFVSEGVGSVRLLCLVSSDTNVRLLAPIMCALKTLAVVPSRHEKDEGAVDVLREFGIPYVEIRRSEPRNAVIDAFKPTVALTAADWTSEFLHLRGQLQELDVPAVALQEGPHDLSLSFQQEIGGVLFNKVSNQYRNADVFLAQGTRHLAFMRTKYFAVTGNPKIQEFIPCVDGVAPRAFINLNFTYPQTKPAYESERDLWLKEVLAAARDAKIPYIISQHPRDKAVIDDPNVLPSHAGIVQDHLRQCTIAISRLSSLIYEAARDGLRSVYFNPHYEPIGLFNLNADADLDVCTNRRQLSDVLREHVRNPAVRRGDPRRFLHAHCGKQDGKAVERSIAMMHAIAANRPQAELLQHALAQDSGTALDTATAVTAGSRLRVAVFGRFPAKGYSGGRIHGWSIAEAVAHAGHDVTVVTPCIPEFSENYAYLPRHQSIRIAMSPDLRRWQPVGAFDVVFMVPGMDRDDTAYRAAIEFAEARGAALILINFESPNWFNAFATVPRDETLWNHWRLIARHARVVLSSAEEGTRFARAFYTDAAPGCLFENVPCAINVGLIDQAPDVPVREKRVLIFTRSGLAEHKGAAELPSFILPEMAGYTFTVVSGNSLEPEREAALAEAASRVGATLDVRCAITDQEKAALLKQSCLLLFPSMFEGLGLPPMEAVYAGLPCVAFDLPVLREICGEWVTYARHGDFDDFRARIVDVLTSPPDMSGSREAIAPVAHFNGMASGLERVMRAALARPAHRADSTTQADLFRGADNFPPATAPHIAEPYAVLRQALDMPVPVKHASSRVAVLTLVPPVPADQGNRMVTHHLISHLLQQGHDVDIIIQGDCSPALLAAAYCDRVRVLSLPMPDWRNTGEATWRREITEQAFSGLPTGPHQSVKEAVDREANKYHPFYIMTAEWLEFALRSLKTENYNSIYCNYLHTLLPIAILREMGVTLPGPVAVITHDAMSRLSRSIDGVLLDTSFRYCTPEAEAEALNAADIVVAITPGEADYLREIGVHKKIVVSRYSGAEDFAAHTTSDAAFYRKRIVYTASNNPLNKRGFEEFLRSCWPRIMERHPDARLQLAGTICHVIGNYPGIEKLGIIPRSELTYLVSQASIVINPGQSGTGLKIKTVEAICATVPFVTFPDGLEGVEEFQDAGFIARDWDDFTIGCLQLLEDHASWLRCHRFAATNAAQAFSRAAVFGELDAAVVECREIAPAHHQSDDETAPGQADHSAQSNRLLADARTALLRGRISEGRRSLGDAVTHDPGNREAYELAYSLAEEMKDATGMQALAAQQIAYCPFAPGGYLDFAAALSIAGDEKARERVLAHTLLVCPGAMKVVSAYIDAAVTINEPRSAAWLLQHHASNPELQPSLDLDVLARVQKLAQHAEREPVDHGPLPETFETAFTAGNVSDANWHFGIWQKDDRPGFTVSRPAVNITFTPGQMLRFRGSGVRRVVKVDGKNPNQNVWLDRPLNPETDGFPKAIFLLPPDRWLLDLDNSTERMRLTGTINADFSGLVLSNVTQAEPLIAFSTYWRRDIEQRDGLGHNQVRGLTIEARWDPTLSANDTLQMTRSGGPNVVSTVRPRAMALGEIVTCVARDAMSATASQHLQLSSIELTDDRLFLKCYMKEPTLPQRLQIMGVGSVILDLHVNPVIDDTDMSGQSMFAVSLTMERPIWDRTGRRVRVAVPEAGGAHWQERDARPAMPVDPVKLG